MTMLFCSFLDGDFISLILLNVNVRMEFMTYLGIQVYIYHGAPFHRYFHFNMGREKYALLNKQR